MEAALARGTAPDVIAGYVAEACSRNGLDPELVPAQIRAAAGLPQPD
jgi:hypothetical protein